jgi:uncharacterized protein (DUF952 family)
MILHICGRDEWPPVDGTYRPESLASEGFVHCSDFGTTHLSANRFFAGRDDLVLLVINPAALDVPVRWEPPADGTDPTGRPLFPHVYGPVPQDAVVAVHTFRPDVKGVFTLPTAIAENRL